MLLIRVGSLFVILSTQNFFTNCEKPGVDSSEELLTVDELKPSTNRKLPGTVIKLPEEPETHYDILRDKKTDTDPFIIPTNFPEIQKKLQDDLIRMREKIDAAYEKHKKSAGSESSHGTKSAIVTEVEPDNESSEVNDSTKQISKSLDTNLQPEINPEFPIDVGKIFHRFVELVSPIDMMGPRDMDNQPIFIGQLDDVNKDPGNMGEITILRIHDDDDKDDDNESPDTFPFEKIVRVVVPVESPEDIIPGVVQVSPEQQSIEGEGFLDDFVESMRKMMETLHNTAVATFRLDRENSSISKELNNTEGAEKVDIRIEDHGSSYTIPPDAYVDRSNPELVNITWNSKVRNLNNSLCLQVSKDKNGLISFQHVHLRIFKDNETNEYDLDEPVQLKGIDGTSTIVKLSDTVGVNFPNSESLDVVVVQKRDRYSTHWLAFSVAVLGLIIAGLIMLLSYIIHTRNQLNSRKHSFSKEPIA